MFFEDEVTPGVHCPGCRKRVNVVLADSLNWGNIVALCEPAGHEFAYTGIDHKAIYAEARKGFL